MKTDTPTPEIGMPLGFTTPPTTEEVFVWYRAEADARHRDKRASDSTVAKMKEKILELERQRDALLSALNISLIRAYTAGYQHGHEATVETQFIPVNWSDIEFHSDNVHEMMRDGSLPEAQAAIAAVKGDQ